MNGHSPAEVREAELRAEHEDDMWLAVKGLYRNRVTGKVEELPITAVVKEDLITEAVTRRLDRDKIGA
jgi:hypothetical protein